jgi:hypothetical protein
MKALPKSDGTYHFFSGVRLYRDDLETVLDRFSATGGAVTLSDNRFQYDSLDELITSVGPSPRTLTLTVQSSDLFVKTSLSFNDGRWSVSWYGESMRDVVNEVITLLRQRQTRVDALPLGAAITISFPLMALGWALFKSYPTASIAILAVAGTLFTTSFLLALYWWKYPRVVLRYPHEAGFFARNRDSLLLLVSGAVIGGLIQFLVSRFLH